MTAARRGRRPRADVVAALAGAATALLAAALAGGPARAQDPAPPIAADIAPAPRRLVLLFSSPAGEPLAGRLDAELVAAGLVPRRVTIQPAAPFEELAGIVSAARAEGAIRVAPDATGAEVWIAEPATGRTLLRQSLSADASPAMISVIALRTVEFLRASLLPAEAPPPPPPRAAAPAVVATPPEPPYAPSASRLRFSLAPAWLASPGGVSRTISAVGGLAVRLGPHLGLEALALVPVSSGSVGVEEGETRVSVYLAGAGAQLRGSAGRWTGDLGAGALAALVVAAGTPRGTSDVTGATGRMVGAAPYARGGVAFGLTPWVALRADLLVGALFPRPIVSVERAAGASDAGSWGRPFGALFVGIQGGGS